MFRMRFRMSRKVIGGAWAEYVLCGGVERMVLLVFGGMAPVPHLFASRRYKRYGYGYGEIAKLVHGRSLAPATTVISHGARNAALPPSRCPDTSRGTGYTTRSSKKTSYNRPVRQINTARSGLSGLPSVIREDSSFESPLPGVCVQVLREKE